MPTYKGNLIGKPVTYAERPIFLGSKAISIPGILTQTTIDLANNICNDLKKDDLLVVMYGCGSTAAANLTIDTAGYTTTHTSYQVGTYRTNAIVGYKFMGDTADSTLLLSNTTSISYGAGAIIFAFRGVDKNKTFDVATTTSNSTTVALPDPAAITPITKNSLILVMGCAGHGSTARTYDSTDLSSFTSIGTSDSTDFSIGGGIYFWKSGAFNPAVYTWAGTTGGSYFATTMALKPRLDSAIWDLNSVYNAYR